MHVNIVESTAGGYSLAKYLYISEKPSVAQEFAKALNKDFRRGDGYLEAEDAIVTWCVGHLVTMSYPESYDPSLKKWSLTTLPFIPQEYKYEIIPAVKKQFDVVSSLLNRKDVERIYVCTDSGREGEYIYRLVDQMAKVPKDKDRRRVWIDSQTEEEILRGIREAKPESAYDNISDSAYLRAKEDYLMGINFSRVLSLKYSWDVKEFLGRDMAVIAVGRVMTCVLGMVVRREREIRDFVKTPFYRVLGTFSKDNDGNIAKFPAEWRVNEKSKYFNTPALYNEKGFKKKDGAEGLINELKSSQSPVVITDITRKTEKKNAPLLFNLAELQGTCSRVLKISPDQTLNIAQELYEKKLTTYPRTDARVLSTAIAKVIDKNIKGIGKLPQFSQFTDEILSGEAYKSIAKSKYTNDKAITDHYAIIPTGTGFENLGKLSHEAKRAYVLICQRFLSIFYPPAVYSKMAVTATKDNENFYANFSVLKEEGYLKVADFGKKNSSKDGNEQEKKEADKEALEEKENKANGEEENQEFDGEAGKASYEVLSKLKKGDVLEEDGYEIKEGSTLPPKRYTSGSLILAMENAGNLIEDEELRAQIKGSGIGTSATRAEILKKLQNNGYIQINSKSQIVQPALFGEIIEIVVENSIKSLLNAELTASWEKGLTLVAEGSITADEYMKKMTDYVKKYTDGIKGINNSKALIAQYNKAKEYYSEKEIKEAAKSGGKSGSYKKSTARKTTTNKKKA